MAMLGSEFVQKYSRSSPGTWEQAALDEVRQGSLTPWPVVPVTLADGNDTAILGVQSDVFAIGSIADHVRMPLTTPYAQSIANLSGALLPTPWLEYAIWKTAPAKLAPISMSPNQGASLEQYAKHSQIIDGQLAAQNVEPGTLVAGIKKGVIISNFYKPGKVLLFGSYRMFLTGPNGVLTDTPAPDVFDDGRAIGSDNRQPIQPKSNIHAEGYVDYSHGIRLVAPTCLVNGEEWETAKLYQHPTLARLVNPAAANSTAPSQAGALFMPRYPAPVAPAPVRSAGGGALGGAAISTVTRPQGRIPYMPDPTEIALANIAARWNRS